MSPRQESINPEHWNVSIECEGLLRAGTIVTSERRIHPWSVQRALEALVKMQ